MEWNTKVNRSGRMKRNIENVFKQMETPLTDYNRVPKAVIK